MSGTSPCCTGTPVWQLIKSKSVESRQLKKERGTINWGWKSYQTPVRLTFKSTLTLKWPYKQVWNKNCCAPLDAAHLWGHGRSPTPPSLFTFFSLFLKSFPFHWGTAAARPSVSGEQNEEERAERSRLTIEGEGENEGRGEKSLFLLGPFSTILGWSRRPLPVGSPAAHRWPFHTGEETLTCLDLPNTSSPNRQRARWQTRS